MKKKIAERIISASMCAVMMASQVPAGGVSAANVEETPGTQLQTILIDNDGKDWTTESW